MAWAFVQDDAASLGASAGTAPLAFSSNVTAGSLLVCVISYASATITATCADSRSQTWSVAVGPTVNTPFGFSQYIFYFMNTTGGACTVTVTFSSSIDSRRIFIAEYSGIALTSALDVTAAAVGNDDLPSSGSAITTTNNELVFGGLLHGNPNTVTPGSGFTKRDGADVFHCAEDKNQAVAGSVAANYTTVTGSRWIAQMATFKEPSAGRTTKNTRANPLGTEVGMGWRMECHRRESGLYEARLAA